MSAAPVEPTPTPAAPTPVTDPAPAAQTPPAAVPKPVEPPKATEPAKGDALPDDPAALKAMVADLRKENGAARTTAKAQAAEDAKKEMAQTIGKALGLVEDEPIDPAKLTESLTTAQTEAKQARVELAVFRAAGAVNGDPAALLDSTSFLKSLEDVDPNDTAAVQAAISSAVTANPRLGAATNPRTPAPNPAQGAGAGGAPGLDDQIAEATKAGNHLLAIALKQRRAAELAAKS